jgi:hypothetical protein
MKYKSIRSPEYRSVSALRLMLRLALLVSISMAGGYSAVAQTETAKPAPPREEAAPQSDKEQKAFTLRVTNDQIVGISLRAKDARLKEIAAELSRKLKIPVIPTPIIERHVVTVNFSDLVLEPAMQMLAPQVYIDYEVDTTPGKVPRPVAIYLQGYNERAPADNAVVKGNSDVMVIEGDTEDDGTTKSSDDKEVELRVSVERGQVSVKSKKQPLIVVLYAIANQFGIPLEVKTEVLDLVNVNIVKTSIESALQELGPNIRLYLRADLQMGERRPLRMVLVGPEKKS